MKKIVANNSFVNDYTGVCKLTKVCTNVYRFAQHS